MFDEKEYRETFSQVKASQDLTRRVMNMKTKSSQKLLSRGLARAALVAALLALMAISVSASETVQNWFLDFFKDKSEGDLSQGQVEYIEENAQIISDSQTIDGWMVELRSAISDGTKAYIIIGITAPENVNLEQTVMDGIAQDWFGPENGSMHGDGMQGIVSWSEKSLVLESYRYGLEEDGDGENNTKNLVITLNPNLDWHTDPFGADIDWYIHIENIVHQYEDAEYRRELMEGEYSGQTDVVFTGEETLRLYKVEVLAEGEWDFTVNFAEHKVGVELLSQPIAVMMDILRQFGDGIEDYDYFREPVTVTSVVVRPLSVTLSYENCNGGPGFANYDAEPYVVMLDGSQIILHNYGGGGAGSMILEAETPIVIDEVDCILLPDGTIIPMPENIE